MKHKLSSLLAVMLLPACQSTFVNNLSFNNANNHASAIIDPNSVATPNDINDVLLTTEQLQQLAQEKQAALEKIRLSTVPVSIWEELQRKFTLPIPENKRVLMQRNWYTKHPHYLDRVAKRAQPFLHYIVEELKKENIPLEIALLPIVESAFDPFAYSHGRASGMWQFVPKTGTRFGMKQNWWYDGRRDIIASTKGAIRYLKYLNKFFDGDWLLALAAYNSGEGRVQNAVRKNKRKQLPTDFWSLELPKETEHYVPKLLALADIVKRPEQFSITLFPIENKPAITTIDTGSQIDLAKAASLAQMPLEQLQRLNPAFNRWATDPNGPHQLVLPIDKAEPFKAKLAQLDDKNKLAWQRYKIKSGDNLGLIAQKFKSDIQLIKNVNNLKSNNIRAGKYLLIPVAAKKLSSYSLSQGQRLIAKQNTKRAEHKVTHIVQKGDTLWDIAQSYQVKTANIARWNGMAPRDVLKLGQKLIIWKNSPSSSNKKSGQIVKQITYKVRSGDSFARIANKFNVLIKDIERWNNLSRNKYLQPGQKLKLSIDITNNI